MKGETVIVPWDKTQKCVFGGSVDLKSYKSEEEEEDAKGPSPLSPKKEKIGKMHTNHGNRVKFWMMSYKTQLETIFAEFSS